MCLFLTNLEIPIVNTSAFSITREIGGLDKVYWIITAYMLGYVGVLVISAKLSDLFGRKSSLITAILIFIIFSGACGASQTIVQLIIFRAFQGIGGAGNYSLCAAIVLELVPPEKYAKYTSSVAIVYALSLLLGPIFGGAISESSTWRWVFLLNIPPAALAGAILILVLPDRFPNHHVPRDERTRFSLQKSIREAFLKVDMLGSSMLLVATVCLVAALEEANQEYEWRSPFTIVMLVISGVTWVVFLAWERRVTLASSQVEPVFPWRFVHNRVWLGMLLNSIFLGGTWFVTIFQLPQRFQVVNGLSPLQAGIRFIPFTVAAPVGSALSSAVAKALKIPLVYLVLLASVIQVVGFALLSTLSASLTITAAQYGYQIIAGFGCGINISLLILMTPFTVEERDKAVAMGAVAQFRVMGGSIFLAIVTSVSNGFIRSHLRGLLDDDQLHSVLHSAAAVPMLPPDAQTMVRTVFSESYNLQMKILAGCAGGQVLASLLMWQKEPIIV
ncbi:MFS general substrate transporter [Aspergillus tamarii]|uniref:MFS general substrate transporter n=1 Tax=Aspergillus tamarii TaxID=41984 RepID=A0A5N6UZ72_ASPTM|nr:MFS general substrate transporter [Aspergillus tamarii]